MLRCSGEYARETNVSDGDILMLRHYSTLSVLIQDYERLSRGTLGHCKTFLCRLVGSKGIGEALDRPSLNSAERR